MSSEVRREMWRSEDCSAAVSQIAAAATNCSAAVSQIAAAATNCSAAVSQIAVAASYGHAWQTVDTNMLNNMPLSLKKELGTNFLILSTFFQDIIPWIHVNTS